MASPVGSIENALCPSVRLDLGTSGNNTVKTDAVNLLYREAIKGRCSLKIKLEREERSSKGSSKCDWKHYIYSCAPEMLIRRWIHSLRLVGV